MVLRLTVLLLLSLFVGACTSSGDGRGGFVQPLERDLDTDEETRRREEEAQERLWRAQRFLADSRFEEATRLATEIAEVDQVSLGLRLEARRVLFEARALSLQRRLVHAQVQIPPLPVTQGDPIEARFVLRNISTLPLVIDLESRVAGTPGWSQTLPQPRFTGAVVGRSRFHVSVEFEEHPLNGTLVSETFQRVFNLEEPVRLEPGEEYSWPFRLDSMEFGGRPNYRTFAIEASLYPASVRIGGEAYPGPIEFESQLCQVMPQGWEHLADDPVRRVRQAVSEKFSPVHVPLAAALVGPERRAEVVTWLLGVLEQSPQGPPPPDVRIAVCVALRILTGKRPGPLPEDWLAWSREER